MSKIKHYAVTLIIETDAPKEVLESPNSWPTYFHELAQDQSICEEYQSHTRSIEVSHTMIDEMLR